VPWQRALPNRIWHRPNNGWAWKLTWIRRNPTFPTTTMTYKPWSQTPSQSI
jgi:hypothetical protein